MKNPITVVLFVLSFLALDAQEVISTQGESYTSINGTIDFTLGEVIIETGSSINGDLTQGFHQSKWIVEVEVAIKEADSNIDITVYPNPVTNTLNIRTDSFEGVSYVLYDVRGRLITEDLLSGIQTTLHVNDLAHGTYSLIIKNQLQNIKSFKLIKID